MNSSIPQNVKRPFSFYCQINISQTFFFNLSKISLHTYFIATLHSQVSATCVPNRYGKEIHYRLSLPVYCSDGDVISTVAALMVILLTRCLEISELHVLLLENMKALYNVNGRNCFPCNDKEVNSSYCPTLEKNPE